MSRLSSGSYPQGSGRHRLPDHIESRAREGAIISLGLVEHRDMWRDTLLLDQPVQHRGCPVGGITRKPLGLETEALLCSLDHGLRRTDFGLANGAGGLNVNDEVELHVDAII